MNKIINFNQKITFFSPSRKTFKAWGIVGKIADSDGKALNCSLTLQVPFEDYQFIEREQLFHLKPEVCSPAGDCQFDGDGNLTLELMLKPGLLPQLTRGGTIAETVLAALGESPTGEPPPQQLAENWFCLGVSQRRGSETIGYRTLWDWANPNTPGGVVEAGKAAFAGLGGQIQTALETWSEAVRDADTIPEQGASTPISRVMAAFFDADDWDYVRLEDGATLEMSFAGDNGRWSCRAEARDEDEQFLFYSICPITISEEMRSPVAEFLTKANSGLILGNFELDYSDGEICYKTSIDVEGDRLTPALIESLVYTNVTMMDQYLPGILAVLNGTPPDEAIARIEAEEAKG